MHELKLVTEGMLANSSNVTLSAKLPSGELRPFRKLDVFCTSQFDIKARM